MTQKHVGLSLMRSFRYFSSTKPFSDIPGPKHLPFIGTLWMYLPVIGRYKFDMLHINGALKLKEYGPVVKEEIVPGVPVIWIFEPDDIQELFKKEGKYPQRRSHLAIKHLRCKKTDKYNSGGLLPTNGPEWWKLRSNLQKGLSAPQNVKTYLPQINEVLDDFVHYIKVNKQELQSKDFLNELSRLFLESTVAFGTRLNSFVPEELHKNSKSNRLIAAALEVNSSILRTDNGPQLWKLCATPLYMRLKRSHDFMEKIALELLEEAKKRLRCPSTTKATQCLINSYLQNEELDEKDILGMAVDMILAGVDTTTYTSSFALYHLAKNPLKQERLYEELINVIGNNITANEKMLANCQYVKAVIKETLRLNPVSVGVSRLLNEDAIFSGYHVPKGTVVVTQNQVSCRQEKFFKEPDSFIPERWLKDHPLYESVHPYLSLPFGHGSRTCIARRLAEQNMQLLLIKIVKEFTIQWTGTKNLGIRSLLINKPDQPINLKFTSRK